MCNKRKLISQNFPKGLATNLIVSFASSSWKYVMASKNFLQIAE